MAHRRIDAQTDETLITNHQSRSMFIEGIYQESLLLQVCASIRRTVATRNTYLCDAYVYKSYKQVHIRARLLWHPDTRGKTAAPEI